LNLIFSTISERGLLRRSEHITIFGQDVLVSDNGQIQRARIVVERGVQDFAGIL
jgi:hypothetical protein